MIRLPRFVKHAAFPAALGATVIVVVALVSKPGRVGPGSPGPVPRDFGPGAEIRVLESRGAAAAFDRETGRYVPASRGMRIRACDLRTGPAGVLTAETDSVSISLSGGVHLRLAEDCGSLGMRILAGGILLKASGSAPVSVSSPHCEARMRGGEACVIVDRSGTEVEILSGSADIEAGGRRETLAARSKSRFGEPPQAANPASLPAACTAATCGTLNVPDGRGGLSPLRVADLSVRVVIEGRVALTRVDQTFANDTDSRCEGRYAFVLPHGASLSRYAMFTSDTRLVDGEIVDREHAREVYASIVRKMQDPALVEWRQGNLFTARIFPIEPRSLKRVLLSYTQVLPRRAGAASYSFPLVSGLTGENPVESLSIEVEFAGADRPESAEVAAMPGLAAGGAVDAASVTWRASACGVSPAADFVISMKYPQAEAPSLAAHRLPSDEKGFALLVLPPRHSGNPESAGSCDVSVYVDTSLSQAGLPFMLETHAAEYLASQLGPGDRIRYFAFDVSVRRLGPPGFHPPASKAASEALIELGRTVPLGGSDFAALSESLGETLGSPVPGRRQAVVVLTDGMMTLGPRTAADALAPIDGRCQSRGIPVHVLAVGNPVNRPLLAALSRRTGGIVLEASHMAMFDESLLDLALAVQAGTCGDSAAEIAGIEVAGGPDAGNVPHGTERIVLGRFDPGGRIRVRWNGRDHEFDCPGEERGNSFVPRLWASARMAELLERSQDDGVRSEAVKLSRTFTLVSPYTSFLVLETEDDYARWGIDRGKRRPCWKPWNVEPRPLNVRPAQVREDGKEDIPGTPAAETRPSLGDLTFTELLHSVEAGDRLSTTALAVLCLEVYYRYGRILVSREGEARNERLEPTEFGDRGLVPEPAPAGGGQRGIESREAIDERGAFRERWDSRFEKPPEADPVPAYSTAPANGAIDDEEEYSPGSGLRDKGGGESTFQGLYLSSAIGTGGGTGGVFGGRLGGKRNLRAFGGGKKTESAVMSGMSYEKRIFNPRTMGDMNSLDVSLSLLSYLGAGHTHQHGKFKYTVRLLLKTLIDRQTATGAICGAPAGLEEATQAVAAMALSEAYGLSSSPDLIGNPARKALEALAAAQRESGGFGPDASARSDAVATALAVLTFKSAELSGLAAPEEVFGNAEKFLLSLEGTPPGNVGLDGKPASESDRDLTAIAAAAAARMFIRGRPALDGPSLQGAGEILLANAPSANPEDERGDMTYLFFGTQFMFQLGGRCWKEWNPALKDALVPAQLREGEYRGTWDPRPSYFTRLRSAPKEADEATLRRSLDSLGAEASRGDLKNAAYVLACERDETKLASLAREHPPAGLAGQMVRMRMGLLRALAGDARGAAGPVVEAFEAAGRPASFLDLAVKILRASGRRAEAVEFLSGAAKRGELDYTRSGTLAMLLMEEGPDADAAVESAIRLGATFPEPPLDMHFAMMCILEKDGKSGQALRMAFHLARESGYAQEAVSHLIGRFSGPQRAGELESLFREAWGRPGADLAGQALAMECLDGRSAAEGIEKVLSFFKGAEDSKLRRGLLEIAVEITMQKSPATAAEALKALASESGRDPVVLEAWMDAAYRAGDAAGAKDLAVELLRSGIYGEDSLLIILEASKKAGDGQTKRIATSFAEMYPYDSGELRRIADDLGRRTGLETAALMLHAEAFMLDPGDPDPGFEIAEKLRKSGDEAGYERLMIGILKSSLRRSGIAARARAELELRGWIDELRRRSETDRARRLEACAAIPPDNDLALDIDLIAVLEWDSHEADLDLHVTEPDGVDCCYRRKISPRGGVLDRDVRDGSAPEIYLIRDAGKGRFLLDVAFHSGTGPVNATLKIWKNAFSRSEEPETRSLVLAKAGDKVRAAEIVFK